MNPTFDLIKRMVPLHLHGQTVIAGGGAIAPRQALDIDVWILGGDEYPSSLRQHAHATWPRLAVCWQEGPTVTEPELDADGHLVRGDGPDTYGSMGEFAKHGIILIGTATPGGQDQAIQVLHTNLTSGQQLVDTFDISTHAWAVPLLGGPYYHHAAATLPSQLPRVLAWTTPTRTFGRLRKVLDRYGWTHPFSAHPDFERLQDLCLSLSNALDTAA